MIYGRSATPFYINQVVWHCLEDLANRGTIERLGNIDVATTKPDTIPVRKKMKKPPIRDSYATKLLLRKAYIPQYHINFIVGD